MTSLNSLLYSLALSVTPSIRVQFATAIKGKSSNRPLLVTLSSTADHSVRSILSNHNNSSVTSISIKPDLPTAERKANAILLKERWSLIGTGVDRKSIRICGYKLYVNGKKCLTQGSFR